MYQIAESALKLIARALMLSLFICIGLMDAAHAQNRSLDFYLEQAIANSPAINEQQNLVSTAELQKDIVKADLQRPFIFGTADYLYAPTFGNVGFDKAVTNGGLYSALANIEYPIFTGKKIDVRKKEATVTGQKATFQQQLIKHDLKRTVTDQYIATYQDANQISYLDEIITLIDRQKNTLQKLAEQGLSKIIDLRQIEIELQRLQVDRKGAVNSYQNNLAQLNTLSGLNDTTTVALETPNLAVDSLAAPSSQFMRQFKLDSLQLAVQQQVSELKYQPTVSLFGNTGLNTTLVSGLDNNYGFSDGVHLSVPIYDGNQKRITRQQNRLALNSVDGFQQRFSRQRQNNLASIRNQLQQVKEQLGLLDDQIDRYKQLLKTYQQELSKGELSTIDYLTVLRSYTDARNQRVQARGTHLSLINAYNYWNW